MNRLYPSPHVHWPSINRRVFHLTALLAVLGLSVNVQAEGATAADRDWIIDRSGAWLCGGYYNPPAFLESDDTETLTAEAEQTGFDGDERVILTGNARLSRGAFELQADQLSFRNSTGDGDARGNVRIRQPNTLLVGERASVNVRTEAFELEDSSFITYVNRLRGESRVTIGSPNGDIRILDGRMTFCAPEVNTWDLRAREIFLDQSSGRGMAKGVLLRVHSIPLFYTPLLGFPLDERRLTGFLFPSLSLGGRSGTEWITPFYANIAPNADLLIRPRWMSARGTALGLEGRYLFDNQGQLTLKTEQLPEDKLSGTNRNATRLTYQSHPADRLFWDLSLEDASDTDYQEDLGNFVALSGDEQLTSSVSATLRGDAWRFGVLVDDVRVIEPSVTGNAVRFSKQPELSMVWTPKLESARVSLFAEGTAFTRDTAGDGVINAGERLQSDLKIAWPFESMAGSLTPSLLGMARWSEARTDTETLTYDNWVAGAALDAQLYFDKRGDAGSLHTVSPRMKWLIREPSDGTAPVRFDTSDLADRPVTAAELFLDNPVAGGDFVGDTQEIAVGLTGRGLNRNGEQIYRMQLAQTFYLADREYTLGGTPDQSSQGPLIADSAFRLSPEVSWNTIVRTLADEQGVDSASSELKYRASTTDFVTGRMVWDDNQATRADVFASQQIGPRWRALAGLQWAPQSETRLNQVLGFEYESCCWRMALVHAYEHDETSDTDGGTSVKLQLELKGLGALGRSASNLLDRLLEGYELSESRY